jgi:Fur family ferric uptake transcriptional regulator
MKQELQFKDQLRKSGERVTTARLSVYRVLSRYSPISMAKLLEKVQQDGVDPVTCYRTLDLFRRLVLVQDVGLGRNRLIELTDGSHAHHHHIWCQSCGKVTDFDSTIIEDELKRVSEKLGVSITSHQLEAYGVCCDCTKLA